MHYIARGGIVAFAISAVDIALWDLKLKRWSVPLWRAVGGHAAKARCYRGGIDLGFTTEQLVASVRAHVASGHNAVKIKIGRDDDVARAVAVRAAIGDDATLMLDANMAYSVARAVGVVLALAAGGGRQRLDLRPQDQAVRQAARGRALRHRGRVRDQVRVRVLA